MDKSVRSGILAEKDSLLGEIYDLTEARTSALARAIWNAGTPHDFTQQCVAAIHRHHSASSRGRAIAALVDCSPKTGDRINKSETHHAETWPLLLAGVLPFLTLAGASAFVAAATGMADADSEALIRRHTGPEKQS
ncbi:hypothetical protein ACIPCF_08070 [Paracoccus marcusii]|uniref:hypothetical protein n=1 Tax=Paracoccus marcusii TaxID=59779 RepID=UPI0038BD21DB